jgi:hypothetical protein
VEPLPPGVEPGLAHGRGRLVHDRVVRCAARLERQVVARQLDLQADHVGREHAQRFLQQLLPGLVAIEDDDRRVRHSPNSIAPHFLLEIVGATSLG